eukprot:1178863-Prorocentrum_minimum.AAC.2
MLRISARFGFCTSSSGARHLLIVDKIDDTLVCPKVSARAPLGHGSRENILGVRANRSTWLAAPRLGTHFKRRADLRRRDRRLDRSITYLTPAVGSAGAGGADGWADSAVLAQLQPVDRTASVGAETERERQLARRWALERCFFGHRKQRQTATNSDKQRQTAMNSEKTAMNSEKTAMNSEKTAINSDKQR